MGIGLLTTVQALGDPYLEKMPSVHAGRAKIHLFPVPLCLANCEEVKMFTGAFL